MTTTDNVLRRRALMGLAVSLTGLAGCPSSGDEGEPVSAMMSSGGSSEGEGEGEGAGEGEGGGEGEGEGEADGRESLDDGHEAGEGDDGDDGPLATSSTSSSGGTSTTTTVGDTMGETTGLTTSGGEASTGAGADVIPSAGCGNATPPSGNLTMTLADGDGQYIVSLPSDYDPQTPIPLGFAFHGFGRTGPQCQSGDCRGFQTVMGEHAVLVYMTTVVDGAGWESEGREANAAFFEQVLDVVTANACIDESRIFAAGTSSGAHFANILGCRYGDRLAAIAPVAGYLPETDNCMGHPAAIVIHGIDDIHVVPSSGETARDFWRDRNGCAEQTDIAIADLHAQVRQARDTNSADPTNLACTTYVGCMDGSPVSWCEHGEDGYDATTHGWPSLGGETIWAFVQTL